jgi:hypothetical protein
MFSSSSLFKFHCRLHLYMNESSKEVANINLPFPPTLFDTSHSSRIWSPLPGDIRGSSSYAIDILPGRNPYRT